MRLALEDAATAPLPRTVAHSPHSSGPGLTQLLLALATRFSTQMNDAGRRPKTTPRILLSYNQVPFTTSRGAGRNRTDDAGFADFPALSHHPLSVCHTVTFLSGSAASGANARYRLLLAACYSRPQSQRGAAAASRFATPPSSYVDQGIGESLRLGIGRSRLPIVVVAGRFASWTGRAGSALPPRALPIDLRPARAPAR